ncbi:hypothetical protein [Parvibaculum sp.]|uniref:hypothetical protein n=1 Tax=Parvibaculum sp. TaxID=2024848 RepID=UPI003BACCB82
MTTLLCIGVSGIRYEYGLTHLSLKWNDVPLNYLFAFNSPNGWIPTYFGQSGCAATRMPNHPRWDEALAISNAMRIFAHGASASEEIRCQEERDLIANYNPVLNVQHRGLAPGIGDFGLARSRRGLLS